MTRIKTTTGEDVSPMQCLTSAELADILRIKEQTLRVWRSNGKGPSYIRWGTDVRYQVEDVNAWLNSNKTVVNPRGASNA